MLESQEAQHPFNLVVKNETFTKQEENAEGCEGVLIESPSEDYLTIAPV